MCSTEMLNIVQSESFTYAHKLGKNVWRVFVKSKTKDLKSRVIQIVMNEDKAAHFPDSEAGKSYAT